MQVGSTTSSLAAMWAQKSGSNLPPAKTEGTAETKKSPSIRELAQTIDPTNMSRNEAREMANALMRSGDADISSVFLSHSLVLVPTGDGSYRTADASDAIMKEKFNMFDAIRSNIEFKQSKGFPIKHDAAALTFLEKFEALGDVPIMDTYA